MARRVTKIEIRKETDEVLPGFLQQMRSLRSNRDNRDKQRPAKKIAVPLVLEFTATETQRQKHIPLPTRVFLYLQMEEIVNLPPSESSIILRLQQSSHTVRKLADKNHMEDYIDLSMFDEEKPTFSITIVQDSSEELNIFSDNPLRVVLYEKKPQKENSEKSILGKEEDDEYDEPIALGVIDLLQFFSGKRSAAKIQTYLYPMWKDSKRNTRPTTRATWQVYTLLPLLKDVCFCNLAYICFESIYNVQPELMEDCANLMVTLSFQSKIVNDQQQYDKINICSFSKFTKDIIDDQNINQKWETLKSVSEEEYYSLGVYTGCNISIHKLFKKLLGTEGVNFYFENIDVYEDVALICNSVHRYILTEELVRILEDTVAFNEQELLVAVHKADAPDEILLRGVVDLSIFLYPMVNAMRFAVELQPVVGRPATNAASGSTKGSEPGSKKETARSKQNAEGNSKRDRPSASNPKEKPTFAIINICLLTPITATIEKMSLHNENPMKQETLKSCAPNIIPPIAKTTAEVCEERYRQFDELIGMLINYIVQNEIKATMEAQNFFCCQLGNLINKVMKLISCDFNLRFPTKTNAEFANLMTTVYKELVHRMYNIIQTCDMDNLSRCFTPNPETQQKIISFMSVIKHMYEAGNETMGKFLFDKIKMKYPNNPTLNFYIYLYDVEKYDFEAARPYRSRPIKEKELEAEYFSQIIRIYINYQEDLSSEDGSINALENLLESLRYLTLLYPLETDCFILLHCLYKKSGYLPGVNFTRWKFENLEKPQQELPQMPISRWQIYNNYALNFRTKRGQQFYRVAKRFLYLGLYKFGEIVYQEIAMENTDLERYLMMTSLKILLKNVDKKYITKSYPFEKLVNGQEIKAFNAQINGSLDYYLGNIDKAMKSYAIVLDVNIASTFENFQLALLRYGFEMMQAQEYKRAIQAFDKCCIVEGNCLVPNFELGKASYRLNRLSEAEQYLAKATAYAMHIPDMWGFLALVNLKMGQNFKALECWKYAKLNPETVIGDEVLRELAEIKYEDVFLYVDKPQ